MGRCVLFVILATGFVGCDSAVPPSPDDAHMAGPQDSRPLTQPLTVSISADVPSAVPDDGATIGGSGQLPRRAGDTLTFAESLLEPTDAAGQENDQPTAVRAREAARLAAEVIQNSVGDTAQTKLYQRAITILLRARVRIATDGSRNDIAALYADVKTLNDTAPDSREAAEGLYQLARFTLTKARQTTDNNLRWLTDAAMWARQYLSHSACDHQRAAALLLAVGQSCDVQAAAADQWATVDTLNSRAFDCYSALVSRCVGSREEAHAAAAIRRLTLPGTKLTQFAGPTLAGDFLTAADLTGRAAVIYFWDTGSQKFQHDVLPVLVNCRQSFGAHIHFVGVSLDEQKDAVRRFVDTHDVPGTQVFFQDESQRGWNSPVARFWGISHSPAIWLVDATGVVRTVCVPPALMVARAGELLR